MKSTLLKMSVIATLAIFLITGTSWAGGGKDRVVGIRHGRDLDDRVSIGQRVEAGVVAEGSLEHGAGAERLVAGARVVPDGTALGAHVALDDDLAVRGHAERYGLRPHERNAPAVQEPRHSDEANNPHSLFIRFAG